MIKLAILGSTGSIGKNALKIVDAYKDKIKIFALSAGENIRLFIKQIQKYKPLYVAIKSHEHARELRKTFQNIKVFVGEKGLKELCCLPEIDTVLLSVSGACGLIPAISAIENKKRLCIANKEPLVIAGKILTEQAKKNKTLILPVDSEHSAIWQCLKGHNKKHLKKIILTASGGPFKNWPIKKMSKITVKQALNHPSWHMGKKITIDSATLMNKGLEVIEAHYLFNLPLKQIEVLIHPESIIHSMVQFIDNSFIAQLSVPDMKLPIQYALFYPHRQKSIFNNKLDLAKISKLHFEYPDKKKFPCLTLARLACKIGDTMPACMNAANEVAVNAFLNHKISFLEIPMLIEKAMESHKIIKSPSITDILKVDKYVRIQTKKFIK